MYTDKQGNTCPITRCSPSRRGIPRKLTKHRGRTQPRAVSDAAQAASANQHRRDSAAPRRSK